MKRYAHLFEELIQLDTLRKAFTEAAKGKRKSFRKKSIEAFEADLENNLIKLRDELINETYVHKGYWKSFKYEHGKEREIWWSHDFVDNLIQHAIDIVLGSRLRKSFIKDTYASIKGRGTHKGYRRLRAFLREINSDPEFADIIVTKLDVKGFYKNIDKDVLIRKLRDKIKDKKFLRLLERIIYSYPNSGLPIGNYISQLLANFYLDELDHTIKEHYRIKYYLRYCDDIVVITSTKAQAHVALNAIRHKLALDKLWMKGNYQIFPIRRNGIDFLGYVFHPYKVMLRKYIKYRFITSYNKCNGKIDKVSSYFGMLKWTTHASRLWDSVVTEVEYYDYGKSA